MKCVDCISNIVVAIHKYNSISKLTLECLASSQLHDYLHM